MAWSGFEDYGDRIRRQLEIVGAALGQPDTRDGEYFPSIKIASTPVDGFPRYVYQDCGIVVPDEYETVARNRLGATVDLRRVGDHERRRTGGHQLVNLPHQMGAVEAVRALREACGDRRAGTLNHIMSITSDGGANLCPADEPVPVPGLESAWPPPARHESGRRPVLVHVIDTGLVPDAEHLAPWMGGVEGGRRATPDESLTPTLAELQSANLTALNADLTGRKPVLGAEPLPQNDPDYNVYYGHGTFIAGVIRCVAPDADVYVANDFRQAGALTELRLVEALRKILESGAPMPDIISLSAGGYFRPSCNLPALADVVSVLQDLRRRDGRPVLVAAAGNDGTNEPFWPAAFKGVYSVGALREHRIGRACFSNHGHWVDLYAPGERLVNVFPPGTYAYYHQAVPQCRYKPADAYPHCTCVEPHDTGQATFTGRARWSGTSFATPIVAGLIAERMSRTGENARDAAAWVRGQPTGSMPGLGDYVLPPGYAVYPG